MLRLYARVALAIAVAWIAGPARAGDKYQAGLTEPTNSTGLPFSNCVSKGTVSQQGTKLKIKASKTTAATTDGQHCTADDLLCLFTVYATLGGAGGGGPIGPITLVLRAEVKNGTISGGHDVCLDSDAPAGTGDLCPGPGKWNVLPVSITDENMVCYAPDPTWVAAYPVFRPFEKVGHTCEGVLLGPVTPPTSAVVMQTAGTICP